MHTNKQMRGVLDLLKVPEGTDGTQMHTVKLYMCIVPYKWIPPSTFVFGWYMCTQFLIHVQ